MDKLIALKEIKKRLIEEYGYHHSLPRKKWFSSLVMDCNSFEQVKQIADEFGFKIKCSDLSE